MVELADVYSEPLAHKILFNLLAERTGIESISHKRLPSFAEHCRFVDSKPYQFWYLIDRPGFCIGAIYLTERLAEIGCWLFRAHDSADLRAKAIVALMRRHPRPRYVANINPKNDDLTAVFGSLGFKHIQNTYELIPDV